MHSRIFRPLSLATLFVSYIITVYAVNNELFGESHDNSWEQRTFAGLMVAITLVVLFYTVRDEKSIKASLGRMLMAVIGLFILFVLLSVFLFFGE